MSKPEDIMKALVGLIGENDEEATVKHWLDSGFPPLNNASSSGWDGAIPVGRVIEVAGPPSAGKTAIATNAGAMGQKMGGVFGFMDHERSFSFHLAEKLGVDTTPGRFIYKKPKTFEESVAIFHLTVKTIREKGLIKPEAPIVWVFDSLAAMVPQSILTDSKGKDREATDRNMNDNTALARATSAHFPAIAMIAEEYNVAVIFLNQIRTKIGVLFGDPRKTTGGDSPAFYFSQRLWLSASQIKDKKTGEILGTEVTGSYVKNKCSRPFAKAKWRFMFQPDGSGRFDAERSTVEFLKDLDRLTPAKRSGYYVFEGKEYTLEQLARHIESEGPTGFAKLKALLPPKYEAPVAAEAELGEIAGVAEDDAEAA